MRSVLLLLWITTFLIGCAPPKQIEKLGIVTSYGVDLNDDGSLDNTVLFTQFDPTVVEPVQTVNSDAKTYKGAIDAANLKTHFKLVTGQVRLKVFGKEFAETGVMRILSPHFRDAEEPAVLYLAVSDTSAQEILNSNITVDVSKFLYNLIDNNQKREILPKSDFIDFAHKYNDIGIDPILPVITMEQQKPVIDSIGLFQNDIYMDSLKPKQTFLIKLITENFSAGKREISIPNREFKDDMQKDTDQHDDEKLHITLSEIKSKSKLNLVDKENLNFNVDISIDTRLMELSEPLRIENEKVLNKLEKHIEKRFTKQLDEVMSKLKELNVDPIGFGAVYDQETKNKPLTDAEWREKYPTIEVNYNVDVNIIRHGIFE